MHIPCAWMLGKFYSKQFGASELHFMKVLTLSFLVRLNNGSPRKVILRMVKLYSWKYQSGVLRISYSLFEKLTLGRNMEADDQSEGNVLLKLPGIIWEELEGMKLTPRDGAKTKFLIEFIRLADALKEKVLVFSYYIDPLMFLKDQLKSCFGWTEVEEILYMDGKLDMRQRQASISIFNEEDSNAKVLLAPTRACCEGISLVGASRVALLDAAWNPSVQRQAISRAYQNRTEEIRLRYYLITYGTIEEDVYGQQVNKDRPSNMVFPLAKESDMNGHADSTNGPKYQILLEMLEALDHC